MLSAKFRLVKNLVYFASFSLLLTGLDSCQKPPPLVPILPIIPINPVPPLVGDQRDSLRDIAKFYYYWNYNIASSFNPLSYDLYIASADSSPVLEAIKLYSPLNSVNNLHYDHFSFLLTEAQYVSDFGTGHTLPSFGMHFAQDINGVFRVSYVAQASPAYNQGVRRGFAVTAINGIPLNTTTTNAQFATLNGIISGTVPASFTVTNPATSTNSTINIATGVFGDDEVITTKVLQSGSKTIGYIAYNTFLTSLTAKMEVVHPGLDSAFAGLAAKGITDLIVDLRYNGGGYVSIAEQMDNAMLPQSVDGKIMYSQTYNDSLNFYHKNYNNGKNQIAHDTLVYINEKDPANPTHLNLNNVVFIVSSGTASAAELVINDIKPYFANLKIVGLGKGLTGIATRSAGKPFGYAYNFGLPTATKTVPSTYEAFIINFESKNGLGQDDYVSGFIPDDQEYDGVEYNWGDPNEYGFMAAYNFLSKGTFQVSSKNSILALNGISRSGNNYPIHVGGPLLGIGHHFQGMLMGPKKGISQKIRNSELQKARIAVGKQMIRGKIK